ncbi:MAG: GNAT family N-acetyltransferase [Bacteroidales bacterium]|nr:GNAT family N-acetyltransferase [Bacteroidales bacterium]
MAKRINENIRLESLDLSHADAIFRTIDTFREEMREWLPFVDFTKEVNDSIEFIHSASESGDLTFVVFYNDSFAGLVGIKDIDEANKKAEIGYWISPEFQNRGIATLVTKNLVNYCFRELNLNRVQLRIGTKNIPSNRVAEKLSFQLEGIQRDGELLVSGFHDLNVFSLLKREYNH